MIARHFRLDLDSGQFAHDPGQATNRQGDGSSDTDVCLDPAADAEIEIRRREIDVIALGFDEHVAQNRHRRTGANNVEDLGEAVAEVIAINFELHLMPYVGGFSNC